MSSSDFRALSAIVVISILPINRLRWAEKHPTLAGGTAILWGEAPSAPTFASHGDLGNHQGEVAASPPGSAQQSVQSIAEIDTVKECARVKSLRVTTNQE